MEVHTNVKSPTELALYSLRSPSLCKVCVDLFVFGLVGCLAERLFICL